MATLTYTQAFERDGALAVPGSFNVAYEADTALELLAVLALPAEEIDTALPLFRRGALIPELIVVCGCGIKYVSGPVLPDGTYEKITKELIPTYAGIAVREGLLYGFSVNLKLLDRTPLCVGIMWFKAPGGVADLIGVTESDLVASPIGEDWSSRTVQGIPPVAPTLGEYMVPYVRVTNTTADVPFYMSGAQVYVLGESGVVTPFAPDQYLTLGDPQETLGSEYVLGAG